MNNPTVSLDTGSESCAVLVFATPKAVEAMGGSIAGESFEDAGDGQHYAMVGSGWSDAHTGEQNDAEFFRAWRACLDACNAAGLAWVEA